MFEKYKILERNGLFYPLRRDGFVYRNIEYRDYSGSYYEWYSLRSYEGVDTMLEAVKILIGYEKYKPTLKFRKVKAFRTLRALEAYAKTLE